jgi:hypothetical protein
MGKLLKRLARWWRRLWTLNPCPVCGETSICGSLNYEWDPVKRINVVTEFEDECENGHTWRTPIAGRAAGDLPMGGQ